MDLVPRSILSRRMTSPRYGVDVSVHGEVWLKENNQMEKAIVATARVSDVSALTDLLTSLQFGELSYYLLQRPNKITNWKKGAPDTAKIRKYTHGRLFGSQGELRWQKTNGGYAVLWLSEGEIPDGFTKMGKWTTSKPQSIYLLGGGDSPELRDTRIPRKLKYPIEKCQYPCVKVIQYKERNSQTIRFMRYTEFVPKSGG